MQANELMIGDWVNVNKEPYQVDGYFRITNTLVLRPNKSNKKIIVGDNGVICAEDASPIPITAEILEKNGWKRDIDKEWKYNNSHILPRYCYQWEKRNVKIEMDRGLEGFTTNLIIGHRFYSVHELQHALRLCGLNELADNFRI